MYALLGLWAATLAVGFAAVRIARGRARAMALPSFGLGAWVTGLVLLQSGRFDALAERVLPCGILLAGAFAEAEAALTNASRRRARATWIAAGAVALVGFCAPRLLYGPGARGPGPAFWPLGVASALGSFAVQRELHRLVRTSPPEERGLRQALLVANVTAALGGGFAIALHVTGIAPIGVAVAPLLVSVVATAVAVHRAEPPRVRAMIVQSVVLGIGAAAFTAVGLAVLCAVLPRIAPGLDLASPTGLVVLFVLALPLDPMRQALIDRAAALGFARPLAARELAADAERHETRADHAERLAELGQMASAVAHELRNPLGVVLAEAKLLEREGASTESIEAIRAQVDRARRFLDDLLRYARPRPLEPVSVELRALAERGAQRATSALGRGDVAFEGHAEAAVDPEAIADVLTNLVGNAILSAGRCAVTVSQDGTSARIAVDDDGPGVPPEIEPKLFEAFTTGRGREGTGLGLAIARRLVERHGGTLRHERRSPGARFVLTLPR